MSLSTNGLQYALRETSDGENDTHSLLLRLAEEHEAESEVHHVATDLAIWSAEHVERLADAAQEFELSLDRDPDAPSRWAQRARAAVSGLTGQSAASGIAVLDDMRELYLQAAEVSLCWEMLAQIAQAQRHKDLLNLTEECHPQTLRQVRWANTMLKVLTPQTLSSL